MIWLSIILTALAILSYLSDVEVLSVLKDFRVPFLNASIMSLLILLCMAPILGRIMWKMKRQEKESLQNKVFELEKVLKDLKEEEVTI